MDRNLREASPGDGSDGLPPSEAWLFAQAILGKPIPDPRAAAAEAQAKREHLEWLAAISPRHAAELRRIENAEAQARHERELLRWAAGICTKAASKLRRLESEEAELRERQTRWQRFFESCALQEAQWNPADHPRKGFPPDGGQFVAKGGGGGGGTGGALGGITRRTQMIGGLSGVVTDEMIHATRFGTTLQSWFRLPGEVGSAAAAGVGTGAKGIVNGSVTAIKNVATLGLSSSQLELIGVTKEDRDRGYDTAVAISTASGQVLIAVGTGGLASALSKGGSIAQTTSGAIVAFDAGGNAVGVVQGIYDASQNGVSIANGAKVAGGLLGLAANANAARGFTVGNPLPKGFDPLKGFASFEDFKEAFGAAGAGQAWHHVVEQTINSGKFAPEILHNPANLLKLPHGKGSIHAQISGFYSTRPRFAQGLTVREWLSKKSFKEQFDFGIQKIKDFGGTQYLPPDLR